MRRLHIIIATIILSFALTGCMSSEPDGEYCKLVYYVVHPSHKDDINKWSELHLQDGVLVKADKARFWIDWSSRVFALNRKGLEITDSQSGVYGATPDLLRVVDRNLVASGRRSLSAQGGWKFFKWNKK